MSLALARAGTFYVAPEGDDNNSGTDVSGPFRSIRHAADLMVAGDQCLLRGGTYRETLRPTHSGTELAPIIFEAYSNEIVVVSGADLVGGWSPQTNGIYVAPVSWTLGIGYDQLFVDGAMTHQARFPAFGPGDLLHPATVNVTVGANQPQVISSTAWSGHADNFWAGGWFCGGVGERWSWQSARIVSSSGSTITVDATTQSRPWFTGAGIGYVWGQRNLLTTQGQWHLETLSGTNALYLRVAGDDDPSTHVVELKRRNWCIDFNQQRYVTVRGLELQAGAVYLNGQYNLVENCRARFLSHFMSYVWGYAFDGGRLPGGGVVISGTNNILRGCTLFDTAGAGVISTGTSNLITRNLIYHTDYSGTYACPVRLGGSLDQVTFNTAHSSGRDIIHCGGAGNSVCYNDFSDPGQMCRDLGVLYTWGINAQSANGARTRIAYNWFHDNTHSMGPSPIIYLDNWCRNFVVDHNVLWNSAGDSGIRINAPASGHRIYHNTLFNCDDLATHTYDMWPDNNPDQTFWTGDFYSFSSLNNLFLGTSPQSELVDPQNQDFRLQPGSHDAKMGALVAGYTTSTQPPPGIGAYEPTSPMWRPGREGWYQPKLTVVRTGPDTVTLSSAPGAAYFGLLTASNNTGRLVWVPVTNTPTLSSTEWSVTLRVPPNETRYFRLQAK